MKPWLRVLLLAAAACNRQGYVAITVKLGTFAGRVDRLSLQAFDAHGDAGPQLIPAEGPELAGLPNNSVIAVSTPIGNSLTVLVHGLAADGGLLGIASATVASATPNTRVSVTLASPCRDQRDCDPSGVCFGTVACILGSCQESTEPIADAGAGCGPSDGGRCDGTGNCLLPYCGTGLQPLPPDEQCDDGLALNGNLPDHCRANCRLPGCGDGVVDPDAGELCDLGASNGTGQGCNASCNLAGEVSVLAGNGAAVSLDGFGLDAGFGEPGPLAVVGGGLFVADQLTHLIRRIDLTTLEVKTVAGGFDGGACRDTNGQGAAASFCLVTALLAYNDGVIVADVSALRFVDGNGLVTTFAGQLPDGTGGLDNAQPGSFLTCSYGGPLGLAFLDPNIYSSTTLRGDILASNLLLQQTTLISKPFGSGGGLTTLDGVLIAGDVPDGILASVDPDAGQSTVMVGGLKQPHGLCSDGRAIYVTETGAQAVDEVLLDGGSGTVFLLAGGADAGFVQPQACVYDPITRALYVSDLGSNRVLAIH